MSNMIMCDGCKKTMFADSRTPKGEFYNIFVNDQSSYDLCKNCFNAFMQDVLKRRWNEDEQQWEDGDPE